MKLSTNSLQFLKIIRISLLSSKRWSIVPQKADTTHAKMLLYFFNLKNFNKNITKVKHVLPKSR